MSHTVESPTWHWLGGRPALDFVNTLHERWRGRIETLTTPADLGAWLERAGLMQHAPRRVPRAVFDEACALREAIDALCEAAVAGITAPTGAVTLVDDWLVHAGTRPQLALDERGVPVLGERAAADSPRRALGTVALDAAELLGTPAERDRLRICASETCGARFYDRSPAGRRRWCSMSTCGNEAKARRFRARAKDTAA